MNMRRPLFITGGVFLVIGFFALLTILLIPDRQIRAFLVEGAARQGMILGGERFGKAFPIGISIDKLEIADSRGALFNADQLTARLKILPLLLGRVEIACRATIGDGVIEGEFSPLAGGNQQLIITGMKLETLPLLLTITGSEVHGELRATGFYRGKQSDAKGELQLEVKNLDLRGVKVGGLPLPDATYETVQGMFRIAAGKAVIQSLTLQGDGIYARLSGDIPVGAATDSPTLNLTLELMPKPDFLERQKFVFMLLAKHLTTPGHYQIPIRGTLAKPEIP
jgi:type II secretion system protein N